MTGKKARIRTCRGEELDLVMEIEDLAGRRYADVGLPADLPGLSREEVASAQRDGLLWVVEAEGKPFGFALCWLRPGAIHPQRLGLAAITLTTFRDVPWNGPLYRSWGFEEFPTAALPGWLSEIRKDEEASELSRWPRIAMRRPVE